MEKATFAAGCFWGVEAEFRKIKGVTDTTVGYSGGHYPTPTYQDVCTGRTSHAESVLVEFDPGQVSYHQLLEAFWNMHDPTIPIPDVGTQYRSVIFYHTPEQKAAAEASRQALQTSGRFNRPVVTEIVPASEFHRAEEYHQRYFERRGVASCHF